LPKISRGRTVRFKGGVFAGGAGSGGGEDKEDTGMRTTLGAMLMTKLASPLAHQASVGNRIISYCLKSVRKTWYQRVDLKQK
jgi:hypothetical protein